MKPLKISKIRLASAICSIGMVAAVTFYSIPAFACCGDGAVAAAGAEAAAGTVVDAISALGDLLVNEVDLINANVSAVGGKIVIAINKSNSGGKVLMEGKIAVEGQHKMNDAQAIAVLNVLNPTLNGQRNCYDVASSSNLGAAVSQVTPNSQVVQQQVDYYRTGVPNLRTEMATRYDQDLTYMAASSSTMRYYDAPVNAAKTVLSSADQPLDSGGMVAASRFALNVVGEPPNAPSNLSEVSTTPAGKQWLAANNVYAARNSVALASMQNSAQMRLVNPSLTPAAMGINAPGITQLSALQAMKLFVENRFVDQTWYQTLVQYNTNGLLRELAKLMAFDSWMQYNSYMQMDRIEVNLATQVAALNEIAVSVNPNYNKNRLAALQTIGSAAGTQAPGTSTPAQ